MKTLTFAVCAAALLCAASPTWAQSPKAVGGHLHRAATCVGADPCRACTNCHYCKRCHKNGLTCGVCKAKPAPTKPGRPGVNEKRPQTHG